ncbi:hypothetical protein M9Y10_032044 [Tritrichomonas musculus]|uniref:Amino acid transporter transmembrane domain-containing protein n=1 Tax=Tritrichomonas musculus TaxID=1915356 RepID=A0ABR2H172_9EUKA
MEEQDLTRKSLNSYQSKSQSKDNLLSLSREQSKNSKNTQLAFLTSSNETHDNTTDTNASISSEMSSDDFSSIDPEHHIISKNQIESNDRQARAGFLVTVFRLLNTQLGAGILSIPATFVNSGILISILLLFLMMLISDGCTNIVLYLSKETNEDGLSNLTLKILKKPGSIILSVLNLIFLSSALVAYLILGGDMITSWFDLGGIDITSRMKHALMILIYSVCIPIALTIPKSSKVLNVIASASIFSILYFVFALLVKCILYGKSHHGMNPSCCLWKFDISFFSSLSIYGLTYALPAVVLSNVKDYDPSLKKRKIAAFLSIISAFILVTIPGITGYMIFGEMTDGNILNNFDSNDIVIIICRIAFFVIVSSVYPIVSQQVMSLWSHIVFKTDDQNKLVNWKRAIVIILNSICPLVIAMFIPTAKPILAIGGAFGGCLVDFIFPSLMFIVYEMKINGNKNNYKWYSPKFIALYLCILFGAVTAVFATYQSVIEAIDSLKKVKN